jgi:hypothetical protein
MGDAPCEVRHGKGLLVRKSGLQTVGIAQGRLRDAFLSPGVKDVRNILAGDRALGYGPGAIDFEDIRRSFAADKCCAHARHRRDYRHGTPAANRVGAEGDTGDISVHHFLHQHRRG